MTNNLTVLPQTLVLDFTRELQFLRDLKIEFFPYFGERDFEDAVKLIFEAISIHTDAEYQLASVTERITRQLLTNAVVERVEGQHISTASRKITEERLRQLEQGFIQTGQRIYLALVSLHAYVGNVFPYKCVRILDGSTVVLKNYNYLNYIIELEEQPFRFKH